MNTYHRNAFNRLPEQERQQFLQEIVEPLAGFRFEKLMRFEAFGQATDTAVYRYQDGAEFVFVPGDTVTLGWDSFASSMDETTRADMMEALEEYGIADLEGYLRENCSPVRTANIPSMLVERHVREIGWFDVPLDHPAIQGDDELRGYLEQFQGDDNQGMFEVDETLKLSRRDGEVITQLYEPIGWAELIANTQLSGFGIPTEDEWEYLCGGGSRSFWRWGDSFDYETNIPHFRSKESPLAHRDIRDPNHFGIEIAFDPYLCEVVSGPQAILKGGDGGGNICGGLGIAMGFLPVGTYYKGTTKDDDELGYLEDVGGDYTSYRRILRLE